MRVLFISGPFRAKNAWDIEQNVRQAEKLALRAWRAGFAVICPHTNTRFFQGAAPDDVWLKGDLEILRRCDGVVLISGWANSEGAVEEVKVALAIHLPVFSCVEEAVEHFK